MEGSTMTTPQPTADATRSTWTLDPAHTLVEFSGKHMMFTTVKGHFKSVRGTIVLDEANPANSSVEAEIDAASLDSGVEYRDNHLRSADFLDVEQYPTLTFKSSHIELLGDHRAFITGDLTIHGVTRQVVLDTELTGRGQSPHHKETIGFEAHTTINRKDFGLTWNVALETGGVLVGDTIKIELAVEAHQEA
jgi:polyisoprenoid-binding protein YceI